MADQSLNPDVVADVNDLTQKLHGYLFKLMKQTDDARVLIAAIATNYCLFCAISGLSEEEFQFVTKKTWDQEVKLLKKVRVRDGMDKR